MCWRLLESQDNCRNWGQKIWILERLRAIEEKRAPVNPDGADAIKDSGRKGRANCWGQTVLISWWQRAIFALTHIWCGQQRGLKSHVFCHVTTEMNPPRIRTVRLELEVDSGSGFDRLSAHLVLTRLLCKRQTTPWFLCLKHRMEASQLGIGSQVEVISTTRCQQQSFFLGGEQNGEPCTGPPTLQNANTAMMKKSRAQNHGFYALNTGLEASQPCTDPSALQNANTTVGKQPRAQNHGFYASNTGLEATLHCRVWWKNLKHQTASTSWPRGAYIWGWRETWVGYGGAKSMIKV